jgi:hypothetical protein
MVANLTQAARPRTPVGTKNFIDNSINTPQYLESVMLLIQSIGTIRSWALRHDVQGKIVQEE